MTADIIPIGFEVEITDGITRWLVCGKFTRDWREQLRSRVATSRLHYFEIVKVSQLTSSGKPLIVPRDKSGLLVQRFAMQIQRAVNIKYAPQARRERA